MKLKVIGVTQRSGKARETGNDYNICTLFALNPIPERSTPASKHNVQGYNALEYDVSPQLMPQLQQIKQFPSEIDFEVSPRQTNNGVSMTLTGIKTQ